MKICQIIYTYPPYIVGGADVYAQRISTELLKNGNEVIVITTRPYDGLHSLKSSTNIIDGIKVYRFYPLNIYAWTNSSNKPMYLKMLWQAFDIWNLHTYLVIKDILKKEKPDVVHIHTPIWFSLSVFNAVKSLNIPSVFTLHDYLLLCRRILLLHSSGEICNKPKAICRVYQRLSRTIVGSKPDVVTAPSQFVLDMLINNGFFQESKSMKLPLGIGLNDKKIEKNHNTIDILYVGALSKHKGVHILINAFKELEFENIKLHILGKGKDEFKKIAGSDPRIVFPGFKTGDELMGFYKKANIVVVPSICYDNSPMVIYESFMNGTPIIGSRIGGIPELVEEGYNGFLFEAGDVDELKEILENLIENPSKLKRLEDGAFDSVKKYDMDEHIKRLEEIYEAAVERHRGDILTT